MAKYRVDYSFGDERGWMEGRLVLEDFEDANKLCDAVLSDCTAARIVEITERVMNYPPVCLSCRTPITFGESHCATHDPRE